MYEVKRPGHLEYEVKVAGSSQLIIQSLADLYGVTPEMVMSMMLKFAECIAVSRILNKIKGD